MVFPKHEAILKILPEFHRGFNLFGLILVSPTVKGASALNYVRGMVSIFWTVNLSRVALNNFYWAYI